MFEISLYEAGCKDEWNEFVRSSKNGTFLFDRNYMDYHSDRFADSSFVFRKKGNIYAVMPANRAGDTLCSHGGLTYGGLIMGRKATAADVCTLFSELNAVLLSHGIAHVAYKAMPWIYHVIPAEEDLYALTHVCHARLTGRDISSSIVLSDRLKYSEQRRRGIKRALYAGLKVVESDDLEAFWHILDDNLEAKYHVRPVHTLQELRLLKGRFPDNIKLYMAYHDGLPLGGTLLFITPQTVHTQYISASQEGKETGALDLVFDHLISKEWQGKKFFDFGRSTEDMGRYLNANLIHQKEGFGGRGVCYDTYEWDTGL